MSKINDINKDELCLPNNAARLIYHRCGSNVKRSPPAALLQ